MTSEETTIPAVGVRSLDEVLDAIDSANRRPQPWTGFDHAVLGTYQWATGAQIAAPVTAAAALGPIGPCRAQLQAECQAAEVRLRHAPDTQADAASALGAYQALAWLCGRHDDRP
ncbi:hypothetical protein CFP65_0409 [Kitasatospora sp. MMS16-BH015]|uniref:hypothetical protein n=1 Tax=Kitasatospora sp. MMS16-BH015 TaxID=2018025 RepID=UPI000CA14C17|nr:hypothetical protein [Kitasatospora sp. MMS16-BH015]AUG75375.1 hypothetical protein CFP65_0409 [Kitasatospora sp. MMS16-BH015]